MNFDKNNTNLDGLANFGEMSRSESTQIEYKKRAQQLCTRAQVELKSKESDPRMVAAWLLKYRKNISKNTFRQYKSALVYYFWEVLGTPSAKQAACFLARQNSDFASKTSDKTSGKKRKNIPEDDLNLLTAYLRRGVDNKWGNETANWLLAGIITGLRPVEWEHAKVYQDGDDFKLVVQNVKNTNGRANGMQRTLLLNNLNEEDIEILSSHLANIEKFGREKFHDFWVSCSKTLNRANETLFGKRKKNITLYSARHQFSADAKKSGLSPQAIAALMGHATDATAALHYGKRRSGRQGGLKVQPLSSEVETVKQKLAANPHLSNPGANLKSKHTNTSSQEEIDFINTDN